MTDDAGNLGVNQLLGDGIADLRVGLVVFLDQFKLDREAVELEFGGIRFVDGELGAVFVVLAKVGDTAGQGSNVADLDGDFCLCHGCRRGRRRGRLTTAHHQNSRSNGKGNDLDRNIH